MNKYLTLLDKKMCCGCGACSDICPEKCIEMNFDSEGFIYPKVDLNKCINCNACKRVCPMENEILKIDNLRSYAAYNKDPNIIMNSSSGGIFPEIARYILNQEGIVFGAFLDNDHNLKHIYIDKIESLELVIGSKYIQSNLENTFIKCKDFLDKGKKVLYVGTPCQIMGLKRYLVKEYVNLITTDVICHGVPSQKMFNLYVDYLENKHNAKLIGINFRDKTKNGWSITLKYTMKNNKGAVRDYYLISKLSEYFYGFLNGMFLRESCYDCPFSSLDRVSDITLGDFWGYEKIDSNLKNTNGLSLLLVNTEKGNKIIESLGKESIVINKLSNSSLILSNNENLFRPTNRPKLRDLIFVELNKYGFEYIAKKYLRKEKKFKNILKNKFPGLMKILKKVRK